MVRHSSGCGAGMDTWRMGEVLGGVSFLGGTGRPLMAHLGDLGASPFFALLDAPLEFRQALLE